MRFVYFLLAFFGGLALVVYREKVQRFTGNFAFAEKYLGSGGTYNFYLLLGVFLMITSIIYVTGGLDSLIQATLGRIFFVPGE